MSSAIPDSPNGQGCGFHSLLPKRARPMPAAAGEDHLVVNTADWDTLFDAVTVRLIRTVGEDLQNPPDVSLHAAALTASRIQAVVLDCVGALDRLHVALKQERSQRPTR